MLVSLLSLTVLVSNDLMVVDFGSTTMANALHKADVLHYINYEAGRASLRLGFLSLALACHFIMSGVRSIQSYVILMWISVFPFG